jgi:DNA-binding NarL/FixJ family response regulator
MSDKYPIRVVIVEDDDLIRNSFVSLLESSDRFYCIAGYNNCESAIKNLTKDDPHVILMDIELPGISGIEGIAKIKRINQDVDIVTVTIHNDDNKVFQALCAGACGYLTKNITPEKLMDSIEEAYNGGAPMSTSIARMVVQSFQRNIKSPLSPRETEVLQLLAKGKSYTMIAGELFIDKETVRSHIKNIYIKLEVNSKAQAIEKATKERLI